MGTKINSIRQQTPHDGIILTSWLEKSGLSRSEISDYTKSGWLRRVATGVYTFVGDSPTLYGILASYQSQINLSYHVGAASALELRGFSHYVAMGKPNAIVFTPIKPRLPKWIGTTDLDMRLIEVSTIVFGNSGIEQTEYNGRPLKISSPERAIMECLLLSPARYNLMDVYYLMEMLTTLRPTLVQQLLENCTSVKVKRLFLYMADKSGHRWFSKLDVSKISLGSGTRSISKGGVKNAKYDIVIPKELADYE
ncbi:MAG: type IV toxin-antitoxin system AbiEi family antitoxin domain-containing protein [Muribaculaceae bacterium]